ncbi:MAG: condensation domain-containing protein, partial [Nocardiaceae bacterium]|nr:condensation domain-containing protein [Nocardiaceae bacterium]
MLDASAAGLPVTAAQSEILVAQQLDPRSTGYNVSLVVEVGGPVDVDRAAAAIRRTVANAEALHVRFRVGPDLTLCQVPAPEDAWQLEVVDVRGAADPEAAAQEWMDRDLATVVDVTGDDALFVHALVRLADDHTLWYQRYHHSIIDGFGISLIVADMVARYDDPDLDSNAGPWALRDLVDADVDYRGSARFEADRDYWVAEILQTPEPPRICAGGADASGTPESTTVTIDAAIADALYAFASAAGIRRTRLPMALLVAYLHRITGLRDLTVSVPMAARVGRAMRRTPGMASTILPVTFHVDPDATVGDLARSIDARLVAALRHGRFRGEDLDREVRAIDPDRRVFGPGINSMMFEHVLEFGGHPARIRGSVTGPVRDLDFSIQGGEDGEPIRIDLRAPAGYREELLRHEEGLAHFVSQFLRDPVAVVGSLEPLADDEHVADRVAEVRGHDTLRAAAVTAEDVVPLPAVHRLSERSGGTDRLNQAVLLYTPAEVTTENLTTALQSVLDHHDGLRQRLTRHALGVWSLQIAERGTGRPSLRRVDVADHDDRQLRSMIAAESSAAADRLDPEAGAMVEAVWFDAGPAELGRLVLVAHHLVVDGPSWRVLLGDLPMAWAAALSGRPAALDPVGTSLKEYTDLVSVQAQQRARLGELAHWTEITAPGAELVPAAHGDATIGTGAGWIVRLSVADTEAVLTSLPVLAHADVTDVMVAALRIAVTRWFAEQGRESDLLIDLERHGREELAPGVDLSRTVGCFTDITPVRLPRCADGLDALESVKEALRAAPDGGIGYGMLRYANARTAGLLAVGSSAQVLFTYLGRTPADLVEPWTTAIESDSLTTDPDMRGPYRLLVNARCEDDPDGRVLVASFGWSEPDLTEADAKTIGDGWIAALRELVAVVSTHSDEGAPARSETVGRDITPTRPALVASGSGDPVPVAPVQRLHWLRHRAAGSSARADHAFA